MATSDDIEQPERERPSPFPTEPPAARRMPRTTGTDDDTEGHLFPGGPSTQGEAMPRIPNDNPHGDR